MKADSDHTGPSLVVAGADKILLILLFLSGLAHLSWISMSHAAFNPKLIGDLVFVPGFLLSTALLWRRSKRSQGRET